MTTEGIEVRSVGNTLTLHESALVEAFNLKAAIQFEKNDSKIKNNIFKQYSVNDPDIFFFS